MVRLISELDWVPIGVSSLEPEAWDMVKSRKNMSVIAGPGAGKTELLAQRGSFLLQTGECPNPRRILAISFKRDSATNLRDRIRKRIGLELAARLDSLTFDAFSKSLLDRFGVALPEFRRPGEYEIANPKEVEVDAFLTDAVRRYGRGWTGQHGARPGPKAFLNTYVLGSPLSTNSKSLSK